MPGKIDYFHYCIIFTCGNSPYCTCTCNHYEIHVVMVDVKIDTLLKGGTFQLRESMFFDYFILRFQYRITPTPSSQIIKKRLWNGENRC